MELGLLSRYSVICACFVFSARTDSEVGEPAYALSVMVIIREG